MFFLSTNSAVVFWSHYALEVFEKVVLKVNMSTNDINVLMVFEGAFKDGDIINMF